MYPTEVKITRSILRCVDYFPKLDAFWRRFQFASSLNKYDLPVLSQSTLGRALFR